MAKRIGYGGDLEEAQFQLGQKFKNPRDWQSTKPFKNKKEVQAWESEAMSQLNCKSVGEVNKPKRPNMYYYGFVFEHDGPR